MKSVCLISPLHISYNPRLVREADALSAAGFDVRVVSVSENPHRCSLDREIINRRKWSFVAVNARSDSLAGRFQWLKAGVRQKMFARFTRLQGISGGIERSYSRYFPELAAAAASRPADLFKAHLLPALPAADAAAKKWGAKLGFDAEDFHSGEFHSSPLNGGLVRRTQSIERKYIPQCDHLTAASAPIAEEYARQLNLKLPDVVLNAYKLSEKKNPVGEDQINRERGPFRVSLYWVSAVVGPDRGLDDALIALAQLPEDVGLNIRGTFAKGYSDTFRNLVNSLGLRQRVRLLEPVAPDQLIPLAARHDIGLALEPGDRLNNRLATSNKLLAYLVAGIPVAATDVPGQAIIVSNLGAGAFLYPPGESRELARKLREWIEDRELLKMAKDAAIEAAEEKYCWEIESQKLVNSVRSVFC